jgi:hypothetical protein
MTHGGLALSKLRDNDVATLTFDYTYQLTDGIRIWKQESADGAKWRAAFDIFDRRPYTGAVEDSQGGAAHRARRREPDINKITQAAATGAPKLFMAASK